MPLTQHRRIHQVQNVVMRDPYPLLMLPIIRIRIALPLWTPIRRLRYALVLLLVLCFPHALSNKVHQPPHPTNPSESSRHEYGGQDLDHGGVARHEHLIHHACAVVGYPHVRVGREGDLFALGEQFEIDDVDGRVWVALVELLEQAVKVLEFAAVATLDDGDGGVPTSADGCGLGGGDFVELHDGVDEGGQKCLTRAGLVVRRE